MTHSKTILAIITFYAGLTFDSNASAAEIFLPVTKDASVIRSSYCCGLVADRNFGGASTVDAGQYHHESKALFGFDTASVKPSIRVAKVEFVIASAQISGPSPASFILSGSTEAWDEMAVTWNTKPVASKITNVSLVSANQNFIDITQAFMEFLSLSREDLTLILESDGTANVFVTSKEADPTAAAYLLITTESDWNH